MLNNPLRLCLLLLTLMTFPCRLFAQKSTSTKLMPTESRHTIHEWAQISSNKRLAINPSSDEVAFVASPNVNVWTIDNKRNLEKNTKNASFEAQGKILGFCWRGTDFIASTISPDGSEQTFITDFTKGQHQKISDFAFTYLSSSPDGNKIVGCPLKPIVQEEGKTNTVLFSIGQDRKIIVTNSYTSRFSQVQWVDSDSFYCMSSDLSADRSVASVDLLFVDSEGVVKKFGLNGLYEPDYLSPRMATVIDGILIFNCSNIIDKKLSIFLRENRVIGKVFLEDFSKDSNSKFLQVFPDKSVLYQTYYGESDKDDYAKDSSIWFASNKSEMPRRLCTFKGRIWQVIHQWGDRYLVQFGTLDERKIGIVDLSLSD